MKWNKQRMSPSVSHFPTSISTVCSTNRSKERLWDMVLLIWFSRVRCHRIEKRWSASSLPAWSRQTKHNISVHIPQGCLHITSHEVVVAFACFNCAHSEILKSRWEIGCVFLYIPCLCAVSSDRWCLHRWLLREPNSEVYRRVPHRRCAVPSALCPTGSTAPGTSARLKIENGSVSLQIFALN